MLKILFIGDISGKIGRKAIKELLPGLKKQLKPDLVIANAENAAHGVGVTKETLQELIDSGIDYFTNGDHAFDREKETSIYSDFPILRPTNYADNIPGNGHTIIEAKKHKVLLINLIGRVFMHMDYKCPFNALDEILANFNLAEKNLSAIIVDIHAEATSEKIAMKHFADGRISALLGTHTHVMTADNEITAKGMAYITDVGMTGLADGVIGVGKENIIKTFLTQIKHKREFPETGKAILNSVLLTINTKTKKTTSIKPITKFVNIK